MATYTGSPFGTITGKLGPTVSTYSKGRRIIRTKGFPVNKGSKAQIQKAIRGEIDKSQVSIPQANTNTIWSLLTSLIQQGLHSIIHPAWRPPHNVPLTEANLFFKYNFNPLYESINKYIFISSSNFPALGNLLLTLGSLEPSTIKSAWFQNNILRVKWSKTCFLNGKPDDNVHIFTIACYLAQDPEWGPIRNIGKTIKLSGDARAPIAKRQDEYAEVKIDLVSPPHKLISYLSFSNSSTGFARSSALMVRG